MNKADALFHFVLWFPLPVILTRLFFTYSQKLLTSNISS